MGFLIVSILIWFVITLSKEYTTQLTFFVSYKNIPQNKLLQKEPIKTIDAVVKSTGFNILRSRFNKNKLVLNAGYLNRKSLDKYYFLSKNQKNSIQKQLHSGMQLVEVLQDTIYLNLGSLISKKVPVIPNLEINYHIGYDLSKAIEIEPDSILISGPKGKVDYINSLKLDLLKLQDVKADFSEKVTIDKKQLSNLKTNTGFVTIYGKVEKFTEGSFQIPVEIVNLPENVKLTTLVKTVQVVYVVALSKFNRIDKESFRIECDYKISEKNNLNYLIPKIVIKPNSLKSVKVIPNKVDFLIQK